MMLKKNIPTRSKIQQNLTPLVKTPLPITNHAIAKPRMQIELLQQIITTGQNHRDETLLYPKEKKKKQTANHFQILSSINLFAGEKFQTRQFSCSAFNISIIKQYPVLLILVPRSLGVVSGITGSGGTVGAVLTQLLLFSGSRFSKQTSISLMGLMMIVCTMPVSLIYFPRLGGMFCGPSFNPDPEDYHLLEQEESITPENK